MELPLYRSYFAFEPERLPGDEEVLESARGMILDLVALRQAPVVEPSVGPAILSGEAAGVFFHEIFGHRVEGHRQKRESEGQTFKRQVGQLVLPETFSIHFDPTLRSHAGFELNGHYLFDNEGVKSRRVTVVENGVLRTFLMSRSPIEGFPSSNGHGRRQPGRRAVARQSKVDGILGQTGSHRRRSAGGERHPGACASALVPRYRAGAVRQPACRHRRNRRAYRDRAHRPEYPGIDEL